MARFIFKLQRALERRMQVEEEKRAAFARIDAMRIRLEEGLRARQAEIQLSREAWRSSMVGAIDPTQLRQHANAGLGLFRKAQRTVIELSGLDRGLQAARAAMVVAAQERRALEMLRDARAAEWRRAEEKKERDQLDEFGADLAQRKQQEGTS